MIKQTSLIQQGKQNIIEWQGKIQFFFEIEISKQYLFTLENSNEKKDGNVVPAETAPGR